MAALDKLKAKSIENSSEVKDIPKKVAELNELKKQAAQNPISEPAAASKSQKTNKKHAGGRKNMRGKKGSDYRMVNIAVPMDLYEKLQEASCGNMTYYINSVLRKSIEQ